jgi:LytS/YehU family sensor histidine kinase
MAASQYAIVVAGTRVNVRDCIAIFAGILGGPIAGIAVGLIGGIYRMTLGGWTAIPCGLATISAGFIGSWLSKPEWRKMTIPICAVGIGLAGGIYRYSIGMEWWGAIICSLLVIFAGWLCYKSTKKGYRIKDITPAQVGMVTLIIGIWEIIHIDAFCPFFGEKTAAVAFPILTKTILVPMTIVNMVGIATLLSVCKDSTMLESLKEKINFQIKQLRNVMKSLEYYKKIVEERKSTKK